MNKGPEPFSRFGCVNAALPLNMWCRAQPSCLTNTHLPGGLFCSALPAQMTGREVMRLYARLR